MLRSLVLSLSLLCACSNAHADDFKKFCARLTEVETGGPLAKELAKKGISRRDHVTMAAAVASDRDRPSEQGKVWMQALAQTNPLDSKEILGNAAAEAKTTFSCPAYDKWFAWYQEDTRLADKKHKDELLTHFCESFAETADAPSRGTDAALETFEYFRTTTSQRLLKEGMAGKSPSEQLALLESAASEAGTKFECPAFRTWVRAAGQPAKRPAKPDAP